MKITKEIFPFEEDWDDEKLKLTKQINTGILPKTTYLGNRSKTVSEFPRNFGYEKQFGLNTISDDK